MAYSITVRNKAAAYAPYHGYSMRPRTPSSIVVHSTEGAVGQSLQSASDYLYTSPKVSAHYLIGKNGEIIEFLAPSPYAAWHAGGQQEDGSWTAQSAFDNYHSIGIECLHAESETWPSAQKNALAWLLQQLTAAFAIAAPMVETHGQIALPGPYDRKRDPTNWPHADFIAWRDAVLAPPRPTRYVVTAPCAVFTDRRPDAPLATGPNNGQTQLAVGAQITVGDETSGWLWISPNTSDPPGIGFIPASYARPS